MARCSRNNLATFCTVVLLLHIFARPCHFLSTHGRYVKREEIGTQSRLRFTSGSYGYYNATTEESHTASTIESDMKMGIYVYDAHTKINFEIDNTQMFSVNSEQIQDFVFLRIKPKVVLNSDIKSVYTINVWARKRKTREIIDRTKIYLHIKDINELPPVFPNRTIEISVQENLKIGSSILQVRAKDSDIGKNGEVFYFIPVNEVINSADFSLHPHNGVLSLIRPLNYEKQNIYKFNIVARDKCPHEELRQSSAPLAVTINVKNVINFPDTGRLRGKRQGLYDGQIVELHFTKKLYQKSLPEVSPPFTAVIRVAIASDSKTVLQNVVFGFHKGNEQGCFQINSRTGQIYTIKELDFESKKSYRLEVIAYHRGLIKGMTNVMINVSDSNDHSPTFPRLRTEIIIPEEMPIGSVIYKARATDLDTGMNSKVVYSIGNINSTYFDIDSYTGRVHVIRRLDRDGIDSVPSILYLLIKATDFGSPVRREGRMILKIKIRQINDNPPLLPFTACSLEISEKVQTGYNVMTVDAVDLDRSSSNHFSYSCSDDLLKIQENNGKITIGKFNKTEKKTVTIRVSDGKLSSSPMNVTVIFVKTSSSKMVNVTCKHSADFISTKQVISKRNKKERTMFVEKFKPIVLPQSKVHKPIFLEKPDMTIFLKEDLPVGSPVTKVLAVDKELKCYGLILYSIVSGSNNADSNFAIDMLNGTVYLSDKIDWEQRAFYTLRVRAWDTDSPPHYADVDIRIEIIDVNDNGPKFNNSVFRVGIREDAKPNTWLIQVAASDPDEGQNGDITYVMVSDLNDIFSLGKYSGDLTLKKKLDYEQQSEYFIHIQALDASNENQKISQAVIHVKVIDINDTPPTCMPRVTVKEINGDFPAGAVIGKINAFDPDSGPGGKITYEIVEGKMFFSLDKEHGILRSNEYTLGSFAENHFINMTIKVSDQGKPSLSSDCYFVCVLKQIVTSERPIFNIKDNPVVRYLGASSKIMTVEASLKGSGTLEYSLVDGSGLGQFSVDPKVGLIERTGNYQSQLSHFWLTLNAHLKDDPSVYSNIQILLLARKSFKRPCYFDPSVYRVSVKENLNANAHVVQLLAVDPNIGSSLSELVYSIVDGNNLKHFKVSKSGMLKTTVSLDRERHASYSLNVSVSNRNRPQVKSFASVLVTVEDVNDNQPMLLSELDDYPEISVMEQGPVANATFVFHVAVVDKDEGKNAELEFLLLDGSDKFELDSKSGILRSSSRLMVGESYFLHVLISDKGTPKKSLNYNILVIVIPKPVRRGRRLAFKQKTYFQEISESAKGSNLLGPKFVMSLDKAVAVNREPGEVFAYSIESGNEDGKFWIKSISNDNILKLISDLDYEMRDLYVLKIKVTDGHQWDTTTVKIKVKDLNDNPPMTSQSCYQTEAMENEVAGKVIAQIEALDPDSVSKGLLTYELLATSSPSSKYSFIVHQRTGKIVTGKKFDRESEKRYVLTLLAEDHASIPTLKTFFCVAVDIRDANDQKPRFTETLYKTHVDSSVSIGSPLLRLLAVDHDTGTNALTKFAITSGNENGHFVMDSATGILSLGQKFNVAHKSIVRLDVDVTDSGSQVQYKDQSSVEVTVIPNKPKPGFKNETYMVTIAENQPAQVILDVSVPNIGVNYKILSTNHSYEGCSEKFHIDYLSGIVSTKMPMDAENISSCTFSILAWDDVDFSSTASIVVTVTDLNDNPPVFMNKTYIGSIDEGSGQGSEVLDHENKPLVVKAVDADSGDNAKIKYSILETTAKRYFDVDANTGKLITRQVLDKEKSESFKFHVQALDHGSPKLFAFVEVSIKVNDINDKMPEFTKQIYRVKLYTPVFNGTQVAVVQANDGDSHIFGSVTYTLLNHDQEFRMSPDSGHLWVKNAKKITAAKYALQVAASDGIFTSTCRVLVDLLPIVGKSFKFRQDVFHVSVPENEINSRTLIILNTVGYEVGECIQFAIINPTKGFVIDSNTGVIKTLAGFAFDREKQAEYILIVQAQLKRDPSQVAQTILNVSIADLNDNRPVFTNGPYYQSVHIDAVAGSYLLTVHATDADAGSNAAVRYKITSGSQGKFNIDEITGEVTVKERFVKGKTPGKFILDVEARDMGTSELSVTTQVEVPVVNEDMPVFDKNYNIYVSEGVAIGSRIGKITAQGPKKRNVYYSISSGDTYNQFMLDFNTGELSTIDTLDRNVQSRYNLTLQATDSRSGSWSTTGCTIILTDVNNKRPFFSKPTYEAYVDENSPIHALVTILQAHDADSGANAHVRYSLSSLDGKELPFKIDPSSGAVTVAGKLDFESLSVYHLRVNVFDLGQPVLSSSTFLKVNINNINDNPPNFDSKEYNFIIGDFIKPGQFIGKVQCVDADNSSAFQIRYMILDSTLATVDTWTGVMRLKRKPPRGRQAKWEVHCTDEKYSATAYVNLMSEVSNEHSPTFLLQELTVSIQENASPAFYTVVSAIDNDPGRYGTVTYSIDSSRSREKFRINPTTGEIFTKVSLDREKEKNGQILLQVRASDEGGRFDFCKVIFEVLDANDNEPIFEFSSYEAKVSSETKMDSKILTVNAVDYDVGKNGEITYSISGLDDNAPIRIDKSTGALKLVGKPQGKAYQFVVKAVDNGYPVREGSATVKINVIPATKKTLEFKVSFYKTKISEAASPGYRIATLEASSSDKSAVAGYRFIQGNLAATNASGIFSIGNSSGTIHLVGRLDAETVPKYKLLVNAYDVKDPTSKAYMVVEIDVSNINDNPPIFEAKQYNVTISESIAVTTRIIQVSAADADGDTLSQLRYRFTKKTGNEVKGIFAIDQRTGSIRTIGKLNTKITAVYELEVKVQDGRKGDTRRYHDSTKVRITVIDTNNSPPVFVSGQRVITAREDHEVGEKIASVLAQDEDKNPTIRYYIISGNEFGLFKIDHMTGIIKLTSALDRETTPRHYITITAYDGFYTANITLTIVVSDVNDNMPICLKAFYQVKVIEGIKTTERVVKIEAIDADSDDELTFSLQGDAVGKFNVDSKSGFVKPIAEIDRERHSTFEFKVRVTDRDGHACHSDIYLQVLDKNDNRPVFAQEKYVIPVRENATVSSMVTRVYALDADKGINRRVSYRLTSSSPTTFFSIQPRTGIILLEKSLSHQRNFSLVAEAIDGGSPALSSSVDISILVLGESDQPPKFANKSYIYTVLENVKPGYIIGRVDINKKTTSMSNAIEFELVSGDRSTFIVDKTTGVIKLLTEVDYEQNQMFVLSVKAKYTHLPLLSSVVSVKINVLDVNDNSPVFSRKIYTATVDENIRTGSFVLRVSADDSDKGDNSRVKYRVVTSDFTPFKINKLTGVIRVDGAKPLDREERDNYIFKVRAYDLGTPSLFTDALVNVSIADLNDNAPEVDQPNATKIVQETEPNVVSQGTVIFSWIASDRDTSKNGPPFTFSLVEGDKTKFSIISESDVKGSVIAARDISGADNSIYRLTVRVTDNGSPPKSSLCHLTVHIVKASVAKPVIVEPTIFFVMINKPSQLLTVGRIIVTDKDKDDLHQFRIKSGNDDNTFSIESLTGVIKGRPRKGIYTLNVEVSDGKYSVSAIIKVIVNSVTDEMYQESVVLTALDISADAFVRDKIKGFANHIRLITSARIENILIWGVQTKEQRRKPRDLASTTDTDVAFAVKRTDENGFVKAAALETALKASKEKLERKLGLSFILSVTDQCAAAPCPVNKKCISVVKPGPTKATKSSSDILAVKFERGYSCLCLDGSKGPDCSGVTVCSSNPCKKDEKCIPLGHNYKCEKDVDSDAVQLDGSDYIEYELRGSFDSIFKSIAVSFRTEVNNGYLFYAKGHDYCFLEVYEGKVRFKFDFGTGPGIIRIDDIQVNDGRWHDVEVIRNVNHASLSLDGGKFEAHGRAKGEHVRIDLNGNNVFFGGAVNSKGKVENGFKGCLRHAKLNGIILPWNGNNSLISNGRSNGVKKSCKDSGACLKTTCPLFSDCINTLSSYRCQCMPGHKGLLCKSQVTCADNPCRNGGTCTYFESNGVIEYRCKCAGPYSGAQCQKFSGLCTSNPCRNGGTCISLNQGTGYRCSCPSRYSGSNCEFDNNPCASSPCYHGAKCIKTNFDFKCECPAGRTGKRCGYGEYCKLHTCGRGGQCEEQLDGPVCKCNKEYTGRSCQLDVNECLGKPDPCNGKGTCVNTIGSYFCNCTHGKRSKSCEVKGPVAVKQTGLSMTTILYIVGAIAFAILIVLIVYCCKRRRTNTEYDPADIIDGLDVKYPYDCYKLQRFPQERPPDYDTDPPSEECATTALYDPSEITLSPASTLISKDDSYVKDQMVSLHSFKVKSLESSPRGSGIDADEKGSATDLSDAGDRLNGPYHWDYSEVPEDVVNRPKPARKGSKEGSRMGLTYNLGYEETPDLSTATRRRGSITSNKDDKRAKSAGHRVSWPMALNTETESPVGTRKNEHLTVASKNTERSPTIRRASVRSRESDASLMESYQAINTQLSARDFNNRYSLALEDDTPSLYLQDVLGGHYPAPPSETCPSDIDTCTRPSLSMAFSDVDDLPYPRQRRMLPSEISCLDDGVTETSYNSDDENDDYCDKDPLDPDGTRQLERDIKILIKDIKNRTEADI